jgi:hypothetical protein
MKIAAWNLNNRVGKVPFRLEAAAAAIAVGADIFVFNEYYPQSHGQAFQAELENAGWVHQALSLQTDEKANRILIASKILIAPLTLTMPDFDQQFQSNLLGVKILDMNVSLLGLRMPWYKSKALVTCAWDWVEETASTSRRRPSALSTLRPSQPFPLASSRPSLRRSSPKSSPSTSAACLPSTSTSCRPLSSRPSPLSRSTPWVLGSLHRQAGDVPEGAQGQRHSSDRRDQAHGLPDQGPLPSGRERHVGRPGRQPERKPAALVQQEPACHSGVLPAFGPVLAPAQRAAVLRLRLPSWAYPSTQASFHDRGELDEVGEPRRARASQARAAGGVKTLQVGVVRARIV